MENSPFNPNAKIESDAKTFESGKDKTDKNEKKDSKKSKAIGSLAFERAEPKVSKSDKTQVEAESFKLFEHPEKSEPTTATTPEAEAGTQGEVDADDETQTDQPEMSAEDKLYAAQQIALERQTEIVNEVSDDGTGDSAESKAGSLAAQAFYENIISQNQPPELAAAAVLAKIETSDKDTPMAAIAPRPPSNPNFPPPLVPRPIEVLPQAGPSLAPNGTRSSNQANYAPYYNRYDQSRAGSDLVVGGIVGYLIGRRRGRIKTERKLLPVQHKLEREVSGLKKTIIEKESVIREAAARRVREQQPAAAMILPLRGEKAAVETVILNRRERAISAPEIHRARASAPPERIGHVVVAAEMVDTGRAIRQELHGKTEVISPKGVQSVERQVETLSRNELLTLSEKVIVEGSTLRHVYETQLISERGLRRLITEYLRGGDVLKAFRRELVEREIDFERDPKLRDKVRQGLRGGGASPTLHKLLLQAGVAPIDDSRQSLAEVRAQQLYEAKQQSKQKSQRKVIDVSLITIIAVLLSIIVVLAIDKM